MLTHLGKTVEYSNKYDPTLLEAHPRAINREAYSIVGTVFAGRDVWHIYEVSFLTNKGLPIIGVGKLIYSSSSECIVESKSLKLYFFSHNMMRYGDTVEEAIKTFEGVVKKDLEKLLRTEIEFKLHTVHSILAWPFKGEFRALHKVVELEDIEFTSYKEAPQLLQVDVIDEHINSVEWITTNLLRSNCKITNQPDWGDLFLYYSARGIKLDLISLARYIISFRHENHFHEEVVEMIYKRIFDLIKPFNAELVVGAIYTRRGGIDICPIRTNDSFLLSEQPIVNPFTLTEKTMRQ
ncbi:MAG: hypothetical protein ACREAU_04430 [Nitrosopumilaceae archaeon]